MKAHAAIRRVLVCGYFAAGLIASVFAATPVMPGMTARTGPPGAEKALAVVGTPEEIELGRRIYHEGIGANGKPITGVRFGGAEAHGGDVVCKTCHRRSGLGAVEGTDNVPSIAGRFIFSDDPRAIVSMNFRTVKNFNQRHEPLTDDTFGAAVREGKHVTGRELSPIMPRFDFSDAEIRGLTSYLRTLSVSWSPGVEAHTVHLATVITPDVSPQRKEVFLQTLKAAVNQKNGNFAPGMRTMSSAAEMMLNTNRYWDLQVWELQGAPHTWGAQLAERYRAQPVFALVSGFGAGQWAPVHEFCENQRVPCWFPSVDATPKRANNDFYSLYFSQGVGVEAEVLTLYLKENRPARVVQLHRGDAAGIEGAQRLQSLLGAATPGVRVDTKRVEATDPATMKRALAGLGSRDALMLWWPQADMPALQAVPVPKGAVFVSGRMGGAEHAALPSDWKLATRMLYPYQLPEKRAADLYYLSAWLQAGKIGMREEFMQSEVYFALSYLSDTLTDMLDNMHSDYLIDRAEATLSQREGAKAEDETRELTTLRFHKGGVGGAQGAMARMKLPENMKIPRPVPGSPVPAANKREGTTVYPRLSLAQGQRFASKGAYVVRFAGAQGLPAVVADSDWVIP